MPDNGIYGDLARRIVAARYPEREVTPELIHEHAQTLGVAPSDEDVRIAAAESRRIAELQKVSGSLPVAPPPIAWEGVARITPGEPLRLDDVANLLLGERGKALLHKLVEHQRPDLVRITRWLEKSHPGVHRDHLVEALVERTGAPIEPSLFESFGMLEKLFGHVDIEVPARLAAIEPVTVAIAATQFESRSFRAPKQHRLANAVISTLAQLCDEQGCVDESRVPTGLRPFVRSLRISLEADKIAPNNPVGSGKYLFVRPGSHTFQMLGRSQRERGIKARMPVVSWLLEHTGLSDRLTGVHTAVLQHLFKTAIVSELQPEVVVGKDYSTDADQLARMVGSGTDVASYKNKAGLSLDTDMISFLDSLPKALREGGINPRVVGAYLQLQKLFADKTPGQGDRFLLVDEGGYLAEVLHTPFFERFAPQCTLVAHTDKDMQRLDAMQARGVQLLCPVINCARSWLKKDYESPMIGESVASSLHAYAEELLPDVSLADETVVILGYGAVGSETARAMRRRGHHVVVFDTDAEAMKRASEDGFEPCARSEALARAEVLISCTGREALPQRDWSQLPDHAIVVNAASGPHELGLDHEAAVDGDTAAPAAPELHSLRELLPNGQTVAEFDGRTLQLGNTSAKGSFVHDVLQHDCGKTFLVPRSGYVVNLEHGVPAEFIQITRALIIAGASQALDSFELPPGVYDLDDEIQTKILEHVRAHLDSLGLDLMEPDFRKLNEVLEAQVARAPTAGS